MIIQPAQPAAQLPPGRGLGVVDATTNMQGVALEHRYGRPILPSFHGAWTLGGLIGASVTLATSSLPLAVVAVTAVVWGGGVGVQRVQGEPGAGVAEVVLLPPPR